MSKLTKTSVASKLAFSSSDALHAFFGVLPAFVLILQGNVPVGVAFAIGLLPASLLGIGASRKLRVIYAIFGCMFGLGVFAGSLLTLLPSIWLAGLALAAVAYSSVQLAAKREIGVVLLALVVPSIAVGLGYEPSTAVGLSLAFILGSLWSGAVSLFWPVQKAVPQKSVDFVIHHPKVYGILLGLAACTAAVVGYYFDPLYAGWTATATMLIMRPIDGMVRLRGIGRALSTVAGTISAIVLVQADLPQVLLAATLSASVMFVISTRTSRWYIVPFATSFLILTVISYETENLGLIQQTGWNRIADNLLGAAIALFYGYIVPRVLQRTTGKS